LPWAGDAHAGAVFPRLCLLRACGQLWRGRKIDDRLSALGAKNLASQAMREIKPRIEFVELRLKAVVAG
jgi:hypothetical protein